MIKQRLKNLVLALSPVIKPLIMIKNRILAKNDWVLVLGGKSNGREIVRQLWLLKHKVYLLDPAPTAMNWRFASASTVLDVHLPENIPEIVKFAHQLRCKVVLMGTDDSLIPIMAEVNRRLENDVNFTDTAIAASVNKNIMRHQFTNANLELPDWRKISNDDELTDIPMPCIVKPIIGQGSKGVCYVTDIASAKLALDFIHHEMNQNEALFEEYLPGRQFNVDGVISNKKAYLHMITEEAFSDFLPAFKTCWYLFGITLEDKMRDEIFRETRAALAAADFQSGAFHVELKFKGDKAFAYDISNRMASDCPRCQLIVHEISLVEDYFKVMHGQSVMQREFPVKRSLLHFYNYPERPNHKAINDLAKSKADSGEVRLSTDGPILEMTADKEDILRKFLDEVYALRDNT